MSKRDSQILEILTAEHRVEVSSLAERLGVSNVTMRKDLDALQDRGIVAREHGYALLADATDTSGRLAYHYDEKVYIARRAAELVSDGSTVMIENGSCCTILAKELAAAKKDITIVTNSSFIAEYLRNDPTATVILLGGVVQRNSQVTVGPMVPMCAREFMVDYLFVGADGWRDDAGFTNDDQMRAEAVRGMAPQASNVFVLTESAKFARHGLVPLRLDDHLTGVITDEGIPADARKFLEERGKQIICVERVD